MFYKFFASGERQNINLDNIYEGQSIFVLGGSPSLKKENLNLLNNNGILTIGINNVPDFFRTNFWIGTDRPDCFSKKILYDFSILKFTGYGHRETLVDGKPWKVFPSTLFFPSVENHFTNENFLARDGKLGWFKNTFFTLLQLIHRLGFKNVYLLGCEFNIQKDYQYAWKTQLDEAQINWNLRLFNSTVERMRQLKKHFEFHNFRVQNCCKTSRLAPDYGFIPLEQAVEEVAKSIPRNVDTTKLPHSSQHEYISKK